MRINFSYRLLLLGIVLIITVSRNLIIISVIVLAVIVGGWFLMRPKKVVVPPVEVKTQTPVSTQSASPSSASAAAMTNEEKNVITIGDTGFLPQNITIKVGETVTWVNTDTANHTVDSASHPAHTAYPQLNLGIIKPGTKASLSFPKAGTYKYHDHLNPSLTGTITVQ